MIRALFVLALSVVLLEGLVRVAVRLSPALRAATVQPGATGFLRGIVREDAQVGYTLVPGYVGPGDSPIRLAINSLGMRDREYGSNAAGTRFVLAAGDSFSFGAGVELEDSFLAQLEKQFRQVDPRWTIVKAGVPGYSLVQSVATVRRHLDRFDPEVVLVQTIPETEDRNLFPQRIVGGMIIIPRQGWRYEIIGDHVFDSPFPQGVLSTADLWTRQHSHTYRLARRVVVGRTGTPPSDAEQARSRAMGLDALAQLGKDLGARGVELIVVLNNWAGESAAHWDSAGELNLRYAAFCRANGIDVLDTMPLFKAKTRLHGYLGRSPQDRHWNQAGHRLAARAIADFVSDQDWFKRPATKALASVHSPR